MTSYMNPRPRKPTAVNPLVLVVAQERKNLLGLLLGPHMPPPSERVVQAWKRESFMDSHEMPYVAGRYCGASCNGDSGNPKVIAQCGLR